MSAPASTKQKYLKLSLGSDIRRVKKTRATNFAELTNVINDAFGVKDFTVTYLDDEKESIMFTNDIELAEAYECAEDLGSMLKVIVSPNSNGGGDCDASDASSNSGSDFVVVPTGNEKVCPVASRSLPAEPIKIESSSPKKDANPKPAPGASPKKKTIIESPVTDPSNLLRGTSIAKKDSRNFIKRVKVRTTKPRHPYPAKNGLKPSLETKHCNPRRSRSPKPRRSTLCQIAAEEIAKKRESLKKTKTQVRPRTFQEWKKSLEEGKAIYMEKAKEFVDDPEIVKAIQDSIPQALTMLTTGSSPLDTLNSILKSHPTLESHPFIASILPTIRSLLTTLTPDLINHYLFVVLPGFASLINQNPRGDDLFAIRKNNSFKKLASKLLKTAPPPAIHYGFECDVTGEKPIIGTRYHKNGHNYDLCQRAYDKLSSEDKKVFTPIATPADANRKIRPITIEGLCGLFPIPVIGSQGFVSANRGRHPQHAAPNFSAAAPWWMNGGGCVRGWRQENNPVRHSRCQRRREAASTNEEVENKSLEMLGQMGFKNTVRNLKVLRECGGDINKAVWKLTTGNNRN